MVEYHVVRNGVDEEALQRLLAPVFQEVKLHRYWSTQSALLQSVGERFGWQAAFGILASNRVNQQ
jgi:hypothetical protein